MFEDIGRYIKYFSQPHSSAGLAKDNMHLCIHCLHFCLLYILDATRLVFTCRGLGEELLAYVDLPTPPSQILPRSHTIPLRIRSGLRPSCCKVSEFLLLK